MNKGGRTLPLLIWSTCYST